MENLSPKALHLAEWYQAWATAEKSTGEHNQVTLQRTEHPPTRTHAKSPVRKEE